MDKGSIGQLDEGPVALLPLDDDLAANNYNPPLRALYAKAAGDVAFVLTKGGAAIVRTMRVGDQLEVYEIRKILDTGTTIALENLEGLR